MTLLQSIKQALDKPTAPRPNLSQDIAKLRRELNYDDLKRSIQLENKHEDLKWKKRYYQLRTIWAWLTILMLGLNLYFTYWLVNGIGTGMLDFTGYSTFIDIIAGTIIINILGLVAIVMHFLFPRDARNPE
jgi:hypothetical protein